MSQTPADQVSIRIALIGPVSDSPQLGWHWSRSYPLSNGTRKYTIGANGPRFDFARLCEWLNLAEAKAEGAEYAVSFDSWGGNPSSMILGSPRSGSILEPEVVVELVKQALLPVEEATS